MVTNSCNHRELKNTNTEACGERQVLEPLQCQSQGTLSAKRECEGNKKHNVVEGEEND